MGRHGPLVLDLLRGASLRRRTSPSAGSVATVRVQMLRLLVARLRRGPVLLVLVLLLRRRLL